MTLTFYDWECGHHGECPSPILSIASRAQARAICVAIAAAISQPGKARARLTHPVTPAPSQKGPRVTHVKAPLPIDPIVEFFMTDDYVSEEVPAHA